MKKILLILLLISQYCFATNYYVSGEGSDGAAGTIGAPWATISKVNGFTFAANDSVLFERGYTYTGGLIVNRNTLVFGAYGTGADPVISGLTAVSSWTDLGSNVWESTVITGVNKINMVLINSTPTAMGRYPNSGYRTFQTSSTNVSITDNTLSGTPDFSGGEVCVRKYHWWLTRDSITTHSGNTISYAGGGLNSSNGYGYIIQHHPATLDVQNEWYFNRSTRKIRVYSTASPTDVKVSTVDTLFYVAGYDNITIDNIAFDGGNVSAVVFGTTLAQAVSTTIQNCTITNTGRDAIYGTNNNLAVITGNTIHNSYNNAVYLENEGGYSTNATITNNDINLAGYIPGMGYSAITSLGTNYSGITVYGSNPLIQYNTIDSVGYNPVGIYYNDAKVKNNFISNFCFVKDDGGGVYVLDMQGLTETGREITDNIIINALGAAPGTTGGASAQGIYVDDKADGVLIQENTVVNPILTGIYIHNGSAINIRENTVYGAPFAQLYFRHDTYATGFPLRSITSKKNILFSTLAGQLSMDISTIRNDIDTIFTSIDSNIYARPVSPTGTMIHTTRTVGSPVSNNYTLPTWKAAYTAYDINTTVIGSNTNTSEIKYNVTSLATTYAFTGFSKKDIYGTIYNNSASIPAWGSLILIDNGTVTNTPPVANAGTNQSITLPTNSTTLTGSGTDADGTIVSYLWLKVSGPSGSNFITATNPTLYINNLLSGIYEFSLTVTDNNGATASDTVQITVNPNPNTPPVVSIRADTTIVLPTATVSLTGSATDNGTIASYAWAKVSGPSCTISNFTTVSATASGLTQGTYVFSFTAVDNAGLSTSKITTITVSPNLTPVSTSTITLYNYNFQ